ncbi:MAG: hypothetical protein K8J31_30035 [Anaerolineae bacterium]|nr:hypothetical protein [Anaerolineae bacterium]
MIFHTNFRAIALSLLLLFAFVPFVFGQTVPEATAEATAEATIEATAEVEPCVIRTEEKDSVRVRVGPGVNRTAVAFLAAETDFVVQGEALGHNDTLWYRLDKDEAAPRKLINEAWVAAAEVTPSGDCEAVSVVAAPPIIPIAPSGTGTSASDERMTVRVPAAADWTRTGLTIQAGQMVTITATGRVRICLDCNFIPDGPAGSGESATVAGFPLRGAPQYALIGRIGSSTPFYIGSAATFIAQTSGMLELYVNDSDRFDNAGSFTAIITLSE